MAEIIKRKVKAVIGGFVESCEINFDLEALNLLVKECITAIRNTHKNFSYSPNAFDITLHGSGIHILVINELIRGPGLDVAVFGTDISDICGLSAFELTGGVFPNDLNANEKLALQKYIITKLGDSFKEVY